ncbi:hypothetical protein DDB_G0292066 [Dictyostelium discoideum AX4]|uniref:Condensin complex subunit 2 n=1 Tax=Dictyostelium discoideum TaxID=44689 RepID=Q54DR4_DICDI|nr:hypothetical protein DDB_G0292066 [Dictyostelium discoideum AX4]EAL61389.1 hypothetical protein DDB_G0292066 [Dictyostelium discoideum AX4]|eukprot:XP_629808.1 hypothetical protein DDB_G0292066 [Dictyostelium discoideum AX4]
MTSILSNLKKRFSIKPTTISDIVNNNDDESEIKQLNINSNNNNSNNVNSQLKKVYKRKKSSTVDSDDDDKSNQSSVDDDEDDNNSSEDSGQEIENVKGKSVTFKEQPKPNNMMANKQLSAVPKSKRKSIIIQPTNLNQTNIDTTTIRNDLDNNSLPPIQKKVPLTHLQISEIYANCIKLSTENKINQKNSWTLKLIDHFDDVLENQHAGESNTTNFQAASCVLDASVKIYSNRVDSVHVDTYKILGGLSRAEREEVANDDDDDEDSKDKENEEKKNKNKKKKKTGVNTLEQNIDNITIKKFDIQFMVDPLFGKTSAAFDEGGAKGLLLNNLSIYGDCKLVFDSNDAIYSSSTSENKKNKNKKNEKIESKINITPWKHLFEPGSNNSLEICPTYCGFSDWSVKSKDGLSFNLSSLLRKNQDEEKQQQEQQQEQQLNNQDNDNFLNHSGDDDFEIEQSNQPQAQHDEIDLNKLGNNLDDGDMGIHFGGGGEDDDFGDGIGLGYDDEDDDGNHNNRDHNIMGILDANQDWEQLNLIEPNQNQNWNGPEHWKFSKKKINKKQEGNEENGEDEEGLESDKTKKKKKVTRKKAFLLDFDSAPPPESMFEPGKGSTLTVASLKKASETSTILPPDIHYDIKMLSRLFNKPKCSIPPMSKREEVLRFLNPKLNRNNDGEGSDDDEDNGNQDYDFPNSQILQDDFNPNENMNGVGRINDDEGYGGIGGWDDEDDRPINQNNLVNNNNNNNDGININNVGGFTFGLNGGVLIDEPRKVSKIDINYARVSKKIDVKSLKTSVWSIIDSDDNNNNNNNNNSQRNSENIDECSFGSLIDDLKEEQNQLRLNNKPTAGEVSIPLAFICVLHLANEKNLTLNQDNINNFIISK